MSTNLHQRIRFLIISKLSYNREVIVNIIVVAFTVGIGGVAIATSSKVESVATTPIP